MTQASALMAQWSTLPGALLRADWSIMRTAHARAALHGTLCIMKCFAECMLKPISFKSALQYNPPARCHSCQWPCKQRLRYGGCNIDTGGLAHSLHQKQQ